MDKDAADLLVLWWIFGLGCGALCILLGGLFKAPGRRLRRGHR